MPRPAPSPRKRADRVVSLLTDFGVEGHHAGVLRGVILRAHPGARIVDLTHGIAAGDVAAAAWALRWSWRWFPQGSVHCAIVDPGVGTARRALAAAAGGHFFVGPDNGLLSLALLDAGEARVVSLSPPAPDGGRGATFHGRDLFAPVAARLALGAPLARLGQRLADWVQLPTPQVRRTGPRSLAGEVVAVDHWGNLVTNITAADLAAASPDAHVAVRVGRTTIRGIRPTYGAAAAGALLAVVNSNGHLEIARNGGRADETLHAARGTTIRVEALPRRM